MKTIRTILEWPDGKKIVITGIWENQWDEAPLAYEGETSRLLALMYWRKSLPKSYDGRAYEGMWENIAKKNGIQAHTETSGEWTAAEM